MSNKDLPKLLWLTNLPAPYRFAIWDQLSEHFELEVAFLLKEKNWRKWSEPNGHKWKSNFVGLNSIRIREYDLIPSFRGYKSLLRKKDLVIVGGWESPMYIRTILYAKRHKIPVILFYGSTSQTHLFTYGPIARLRKWLMTKPNKFVTISDQSTKSLTNFGVDSRRILTLFNCVDGEWFKSQSEYKHSGEKFGHQYIFVGQLIERKNISSIINAFSSIKNQFDTLKIVGVGYLENNLKLQVESLGLQDSVQFLGHLEGKALVEKFSQSDTLILASIKEVWGLVVNEALACGLHVVVSKNCGVSELVNGMRGVYVCDFDTLSISDALNRSRISYRGRIVEPQILKYSPKLFAEKLSDWLLDS